MSLAALRQQLAAVIAPQLPSVPGSGVSTGIAALDAALSDGGLPCGRLTEIVGRRGSGKTTLIRTIVAQALADQRWVAYIDAGRTLAPTDWAPLATTDRLWIVRPPSRTGDGRRETGDAPPQAERPLGPWCADVLLRSGAFGLVVLDGAGPLAAGVAVRLTRLARESHAAFVVLREEEDVESYRNPTVGSQRNTKRGVQRVVSRESGLVGGAVRLRVRRQESRQGHPAHRTDDGRPDARWASLGRRLADVQDGAPRRPTNSIQDEASRPPLLPSRNPSPVPRPPSPVFPLVLQVAVEKGGTHHVVEVACAIEVARRLCAHSQVPDRRGVATRNRRGERVVAAPAGKRDAVGAADGGGGGRGSGAGRETRDGGRGTLPPKRRCATPTIARDAFLLAPPDWLASNR